jgi:hypothetical protein
MGGSTLNRSLIRGTQSVGPRLLPAPRPLFLQLAHLFGDEADELVDAVNDHAILPPTVIENLPPGLKGVSR